MASPFFVVVTVPCRSTISPISSIDAVLGAYGMICSQDLTGPSGPAEFFFACTDQKP